MAIAHMESQKKPWFQTINQFAMARKSRWFPQQLPPPSSQAHERAYIEAHLLAELHDLRAFGRDMSRVRESGEWT